MVLGERGRGFTQRVFGPVARVLVRAGVSADAVTITGTVLAVAAAWGLLAFGHLVAGAVVLGVVLLSDSIDGQMARLTGGSTKWGAFLDSTLDRVADGAVFSAMAFWALQSGSGAVGFEAASLVLAGAFACALVPLALLVSYVRARAEAVGLSASGGLAERADRLLITLLATAAVGAGLHPVVAALAFGYAALASAITVVQRLVSVRRQTRPDGAPGSRTL